VATGLAVAAGAGMLSGCTVINDITNAVNTMEANRSIINAFNKNLKSGEKVAFEATYVTTGNAPVTVIYAVDPPKEVDFQEAPGGPGTQAGNNAFDLVANSSGGYSCSPSSSGAGSAWSCTKLGNTKSVVQSGVVAIYTPAHWIAFLDVVAIAAGLAGDSVKSTHETINGFAMDCVNLVVQHVSGTSTLCTTSQGILGYVHAAGDSTSFEIRSYTKSPPASVFELPPGATITSPSTS
jgi:hypothetical protein